MPDSILFLTLRTFSATGGIEKVSRIVGKALSEMEPGMPPGSLNIYSMYDTSGEVDSRYFSPSIFKGFGRNKLKFVVAATRRGVGKKMVILSHSNLLLPAFLIKLFSPETKIILLAHGIEVWDRFPYWKKIMLNKCDHVLAVSSFTKARMIAVHGIDDDKITVLNNCLDPYLLPSLETEKHPGLVGRYGLDDKGPVLLTITRLSSKEKYKGYDNVLHAVKDLKDTYPGIKYLVVGKYDAGEKKRLDAMVQSLDLTDQVIFTGFIPDEEVAAHYSIADIYIMPSKKEGFGIVFIEAMYYGKPVIAGNKDG